MQYVGGFEFAILLARLIEPLIEVVERDVCSKTVQGVWVEFYST